ncbi:glycosyltransferase [Pseudoalteromonas sp. SSMSWG5]|uniref:glycosyltransferase n=1 Tax=Pseudoalteromonas sp. SSMSWG5 TaxID=3139396 RepID=UPI003BA89975
MAKQLFDINAFRAQPLPTEDEIIANWQGDIDKPVVSVLCNTFNQKMYIEDAFRGFLIQKTDFSFEVIVHDDASTDGTSDIVKKYARRYPKIFKPVIQTVNQYSQGKKPSLLSSKHAKGEYFALCEGDDFWVDDSKLQKQLLTLISSNEVELCFGSAIGLNGNGECIKIANYSDSRKHFSLAEVIRGGGGMMPTASLLLKRTVFDNIPGWFKLAPVGDYYLQVLASKNAGAIFLPDTLIVYRVAASNSWSVNRFKNLTADSILREYQQRLWAIEALSNEVNDVYRNDFEYKISMYLYEGLTLSLRISNRNNVEYFRSEINVNSLSFKRKLILLLTRFPFFIDFFPFLYKKLMLR